MKRFLTFILALALMLSLTSCDSTYTSENDDYTQGIIKYQQKETLEYNNDETSRFDDVEYIEVIETEAVDNSYNEATEQANNQYVETVYVSNSGKIHRIPNCSGMKNYTEMSKDEAVSRGYSYCKNCY